MLRCSITSINVSDKISGSVSIKQPPPTSVPQIAANRLLSKCCWASIGQIDIIFDNEER